MTRRRRRAVRSIKRPHTVTRRPGRRQPAIRRRYPEPLMMVPDHQLRRGPRLLVVERERGDPEERLLLPGGRLRPLDRGARVGRGPRGFRRVRGRRRLDALVGRARTRPVLEGHAGARKHRCNPRRDCPGWIKSLACSLV